VCASDRKSMPLQPPPSARPSGPVRYCGNRDRPALCGCGTTGTRPGQMVRLKFNGLFGFANVVCKSEDIFLHIEVLASPGLSDLQAGRGRWRCVSSKGERGQMGGRGTCMGKRIRLDSPAPGAEADPAAGVSGACLRLLLQAARTAACSRRPSVLARGLGAGAVQVVEVADG